VAAALARLIPAGESAVRLAATEHLDDGTPIAVAVDITREERESGARAHVSFDGSGPVHPGNLNTTRAVVRSALLYVLRLLVDEPLPLNEGLLGPVTLDIPTPTILDPFGALSNPGALDPAAAPAVVGGNTETSQRIVDTLCRALGVAAGSQGTMNNTLFGNDRFGYYETVCGGSGATSEGPGASAVHTHMTNTRITDPEILERRYPVRLERFAVRRGSGGAGRHRGGDGAIREITFLEELELSVLGQHRRQGPYGLAGGRPGATGRVRLVRAADGGGGEIEELASVDGRTVRPGDRLITETPGGGGWGRPAEANRDEEGEEP
jgi:5-oxoprolinase (ATP-hydrolysing)